MWVRGFIVDVAACRISGSARKGSETLAAAAAMITDDTTLPAEHGTKNLPDEIHGFLAGNVLLHAIITLCMSSLAYR